MGNAGSAHGQFQRALASRLPDAALAAAHDLPQPLQLPDALALTLVLSRVGDRRYRRAAARWATRLTNEHDVDDDAEQLVRAALRLLPAQPTLGGQALALACEHHGRDDLARVIDRWLNPGRP